MPSRSGALAAALLFVCAGAYGYAQQTPTTRELPPAAGQEMVVVGCVETESVYRQIAHKGRGGVLGSGFGEDDEFVLMRTTEPADAGTPRAVGTSGSTTDRVFAITGDLEAGLVRGLGRQVLVVGTIENTNDLPRLNVTLWHEMSDYCPR